MDALTRDGRPIAPPARIDRDGSRQRAYAARADRSVEALCAFAGLGLERARSLLGTRLRRLVRRAATSPRYREAFAAAHLGPYDVRTLDDLRHMPLLARDTLAERLSDLAVYESPSHATTCVVVKSSGTTGQPAPVVKDGYDCVHMWAVLRFFARRLAIELPPRPSIVLLCSLPGGLEYEAPVPLVRDGRLARISLARPEARARLEAAGPHVLFSDPAGMHWIAGEAPGIAPRMLLTSAQHFSVHEREAVASVCSAPVVNYYATTETGPIAWECLAAPGTFHALAPDVWVEDAGGELVVTRLRRSVLPLLRYRTGDRGQVAWTRCPCGFSGQSILHFRGRSACAFVNPAGEAVDAWQLAFLWKHLPLRDVTLTQERAGAFHLRLGDRVDEDSLARLLDRLRRGLGKLGWDPGRVAIAVAFEAARPGAKPDAFRSEVSGAPG
ncbi:MAG: coenzyme synthetase [Acidobacteriota bacterium]